MKDITPSHDVPPLVAARRAKGLSREGLAFKARVSFKTIERLEKGETETPRRLTGEAIAAVLDCRAEDIWPDLEVAA